MKPPISRMKLFNFAGGGKRRRGRPGVMSETRGFNLSVRLLLFLLLSPVPTCYAARGDSCTTEIPKLVQNNPGITQISQNTCSQGKKSDAMLLPSHTVLFHCGVLFVQSNRNKENSYQYCTPRPRIECTFPLFSDSRCLHLFLPPTGLIPTELGKLTKLTSIYFPSTKVSGKFVGRFDWSMRS